MPGSENLEDLKKLLSKKNVSCVEINDIQTFLKNYSGDIDALKNALITGLKSDTVSAQIYSLYELMRSKTAPELRTLSFNVLEELIYQDYLLVDSHMLTHMAHFYSTNTKLSTNDSLIKLLTHFGQQRQYLLVQRGANFYAKPKAWWEKIYHIFTQDPDPFRRIADEAQREEILKNTKNGRLFGINLFFTRLFNGKPSSVIKPYDDVTPYAYKTHLPTNIAPKSQPTLSKNSPPEEKRSSLMPPVTYRLRSIPTRIQRTSLPSESFGLDFLFDTGTRIIPTVIGKIWNDYLTRRDRAHLLRAMGKTIAMDSSDRGINLRFFYRDIQSELFEAITTGNKEVALEIASTKPMLFFQPAGKVVAGLYGRKFGENTTPLHILFWSMEPMIKAISTALCNAKPHLADRLLANKIDFMEKGLLTATIANPRFKTEVFYDFSPIIAALTRMRNGTVDERRENGVQFNNALRDLPGWVPQYICNSVTGIRHRRLDHCTRGEPSISNGKEKIKWSELFNSKLYLIYWYAGDTENESVSFVLVREFNANDSHFDSVCADTTDAFDQLQGKHSRSIEAFILTATPPTNENSLSPYH